MGILISTEPDLKFRIKHLSIASALIDRGSEYGAPKPDGRLYITVCNNSTLRINSTDNSDFSRELACYNDFYENGDYNMFTIAHFLRSIVLYDNAYRSSLVAPIFDVVSITSEAYGSQTGVLLRKK